jgi:serine/threonine protein kinase
MTDTTSLQPKCPQCGGSLADDAPEGLCGRCLARLCLARDSVVTRAEAFAAEPPSPEDIAPYFPQLEVLTCLGRGGMGVVYKARQKSLDRFVALKILAPEREKDPQFAERFAREAQALARLNHPHIVTIYDFGQTDGLFFLLMEFVDGLSLRQLLQAHRLEPQAALAIVPPICEALQYAHDRGVVHRDIKPENLLLDKAGQIKIADFGIAKMLGKETPLDKQPCAGTPAYMAPEQSAAAEVVDHRADIYSLGVVLYEMLTGELPAGQFAIPSRKVRIDVRLDEIVLRALQHEPELRFQQAGQMQTAVETYVNAGQEARAEMPRSSAHVTKTQVPQGVPTANQRMWIPVTLVTLFLAAGLAMLSRFKGPLADDSPPLPKSQFAAASRRGSEAFDRGEYAQAAVAWDEAIGLEPDHSEVYRWRGDASLNLREFERALSEYEKAIALDPKNAMAYLMRGITWTKKGEADKALADFQRAVALKPELANTPRYQRYARDAESLRSKAQNPKFTETARRGLDAFDKGDFAQALIAFDEAIGLDPDHSEAHRWRGDALLNQGEFDQALSAYDDAIRLDPKNAMAYVSRGMAWTEKREPGPAILAFETAVRLDPKQARRSLYKRYRAAAESLGPASPTAEKN